MSALEVAGLGVTRGRQSVLADCSLRLDRGEFVGLVGRNGSGKSTLLRACAGLLPFETGTISLAGKPLERRAPDGRSHALAFLPQSARFEWPLSVRDAVVLGRYPTWHTRGRPSDDDWNAADSAIATTGLVALATRPVDALSGGEQARVHVARLLAGGEPLLLVDEPTAHLDPNHKLQVLELFRREAGGGRAVLMAVHDLAAAARYCDRLALLHDGHVALDGTPFEVLGATQTQTVFGVALTVTALDDRGRASVTIQPATGPATA